MAVLENLREWGLTEKESRLYLHLLKHQDSSAQDLARGTTILRQSIYEILPHLEELGLITKITKNKKSVYNALNPDILLTKLDEKKSMIAQVLPELQNFTKLAQTSSKAQVYEGIAGIRSIFAEALEVGKPIKFILPLRGEEKIKEFFVSNFVKRRIEKEIPMQILRGGIKSEFQKTIDTDVVELREVKFLETVLPLQIQIGVFGDRFFIASFGERIFGVMIQDEIIASSVSLLFDILWNQGKEF